jgi:hypothetical protein
LEGGAKVARTPGDWFVVIVVVVVGKKRAARERAWRFRES